MTQHRWRIELNSEAPHNKPQWVELRHESGKLYRYVERFEAEEAMEKLLRYQPHMRSRMRIAPM